jgi:hypothetical protein
MSATGVGVEFEYSTITEDAPKVAPGLKTYMGNGMLITPGRKAQLYFALGVGHYTETLTGVEQSGTATAFGIGIKWKLLGPIRLRGDYRTISLRGTPVVSKPKRFYVGISIGR